jgi:hypothetical protein
VTDKSDHISKFERWAQQSSPPVFVVSPPSSRGCPTWPKMKTGTRGAPAEMAMRMKPRRLFRNTTCTAHQGSWLARCRNFYPSIARVSSGSSTEDPMSRTNENHVRVHIRVDSNPVDRFKMSSQPQSAKQALCGALARDPSSRCGHSAIIGAGRRGTAAHAGRTSLSRSM